MSIQFVWTVVLAEDNISWSEDRDRNRQPRVKISFSYDLYHTFVFTKVAPESCVTSADGRLIERLAPSPHAPHTRAWVLFKWKVKLRKFWKDIKQHYISSTDCDWDNTIDNLIRGGSSTPPVLKFCFWFVCWPLFTV